MLIRSKMIQNIEASKVLQTASYRFVTDVQTAAWDAKYDAADVTGSQAGLMTVELYNKLAGIAEGANNYTHPAAHDPSIITQDASNRFVTDVQIAAWDAKADTDVATTLADGLMSSTDKTKLDGIAENANNYSHPAEHDADMINDDGSAHKFVSAEQITTWDGKQDALGYTAENVANKGVANGYASLDANGKVPIAQIPDSAQGQTVIVADYTAADAIDFTTWNTGDRLIVLSAPDGSREGYIFEDNDGDDVGSFISGTYGDNVDKFYQDSDTDWANVNLSWANIVDGPSVSVADIDTVVGYKAQIEADTAKLAGIAAGAEVNQNAFAIVSDGTTDVSADAKSDKVTFTGGTNISVVAADNAGDASVTIAVTGKVASAAAADTALTADAWTTARTITLGGDLTGSVALDGSGDVTLNATVVGLATHTHEISEVTGLQAALDGKASTAVATTSTDGLMSAADKTKLDGVQNRFTKSLLVAVSSTITGEGTLNTGIMTDGSGQNYTDKTSVNEIQMYVNGMLMVPGASYDYDLSVDVNDEVVMTWKARHFSLDSQDEVLFQFSQLA